MGAVKRRWVGGAAWVASLVLVVLLFGWKANAVFDRGSVHNWDIVGYSACVASFDSSDPVEVHRRAYDAVQVAFPKRAWEAAVEHGHYRRKTHEEPAVLAQQKTFYCQRVLYTGLVYGVHKAGLTLVSSMTAVSAAAFFLTGVLLWVWISHHLPAWVAAPVALGLGFNYPILHTARVGSPDSLCTLLIVAGVYVLLQHRTLWLALLLFLAAVFTRGDSIIFVGLTMTLLLLATPLKSPRRIALLVAGLVAAGVAYVATSWWAGSPSWWVLFQFSLGRRTPFLDRVDPSFDVDFYWTTLKKRFLGLWGETLFWHLGLGVLAAWALARGSRLRALPATALVAISCVGTMVLRYALFPSMYLRLYLPYFLVVEVLLVIAIAAHVVRRDDARA